MPYGEINRSLGPPLRVTTPQYPVCTRCGSHNVVRDAYAKWDGANKHWVVSQVYDFVFCFHCDAGTLLEWKVGESTPTTQVRDFNDAFRRTRDDFNEMVNFGPGIEELGSSFLAAAKQAIHSFDVFNETSDPKGEHEAGSLQVEGKTIFFQIRYFYDRFTGASEAADPADPRTQRVLVISLEPIPFA